MLKLRALQGTAVFMVTRRNPETGHGYQAPQCGDTRNTHSASEPEKGQSTEEPCLGPPAVP